MDRRRRAPAATAAVAVAPNDFGIYLVQEQLTRIRKCVCLYSGHSFPSQEGPKYYYPYILRRERARERESTLEKLGESNFDKTMAYYIWHPL